MAKILIIGAGAMGSAFSFLCQDRQHQVKIVGTHLENNFIDELKNNNLFHPALKHNLNKETDIVKYINLKNELINNPDLIVLAVNSKGINWGVDLFNSIYQNKSLPPIVLLTKGLSIYKNKYELLVDKLDRLLTSKGFKNINISAVGGPCLATGLANRVHTSVIFANKNLKTVRWLKDIFSTNYYHPSISNDIIGVEVCAAIKNIYSIVLGFSKEFCSETIESKLKEINHLNTAASLISQSLYEMKVFVEFLNGNKNTVYGLAGLGDLIVSTQGGRNSMMGAHMSKGPVYSETKIKTMPNETIEGAELIFEIGSKIKEDFNINNMPLLIGMVNAILDDNKFKIHWNNFQ